MPDNGIRRLETAMKHLENSRNIPDKKLIVIPGETVSGSVQLQNIPWGVTSYGLEESIYLYNSQFKYFFSIYRQNYMG